MTQQQMDIGNDAYLCYHCEHGQHRKCLRGTPGNSCECIKPIHRIEHEEGDNIYRLAGRIRGCVEMITELTLYGVPLANPMDDDASYNNDEPSGDAKRALEQLQDIAKRLDGVGDNIAVVAHLLYNPTNVLVVETRSVP